MNTQSYGLGQHIGSFVVLALLVWGIFKCVGISRRPTASIRSVRSLAVALAGWSLVSLTNWVNGSVRGPLSAEGRLATAVILLLCVALFIIAIVFAVRGLREIRERTAPDEMQLVEGRGMAIWALIVSAIPAVAIPAIIMSRAYLATGTAPAASVPIENWTRLAPPMTSCSILFPGSPTESKTTEQGPNGEVTQRTYSLQAGPGEYKLSVTHNVGTTRANANDMFNQLEEGISARARAKVVSHSQLWIGEIPGRELHLTGPRKAKVRIQLFATETRTYQLTVALPNDAADEDADRFFKSFALQP